MGMEINTAQLLFDFIRFNNDMIKFLAGVARHSKNAHRSTTLINLSLECRLFIEQLQAEIKNLSKTMDTMHNVEYNELNVPLPNVDQSISNNGSAIAIAKINLLLKNYSSALSSEKLLATTRTLLKTHHAIIDSYTKKMR